VWKRDGVAISGATASTYRLTADDLSRRITVEVTGSASGFATTAKESAVSVVVTAATMTTTPVPTISGSAVVGSTLSAVAGTWVPATDSFTYIWKRGLTVISGASSSSYVVQTADAGQVITVTVTGVKAGYISVSKVSTATVAVVSPFTTALVPTISGSLTVGSTLTVVTGSWLPAPTFAYVWKRNGVAISGATASTYRLVASDLGMRITVEVTGTASRYVPTMKSSAETIAVLPSAFVTAPTPVISGSINVGSTLTATSGAWSPVATLTYKWTRDGVAIAGATASTYRLTADDLSRRITVEVTGSASGYVTTTVTSAQTVSVAASVFIAAPVPTITGSLIVGSTLTAVTGSWLPAPTFAFVWKRDGVAISGATASTYRLTADDLSRRITVEVTGSASGYVTTTVTSAQTAAVAASA
jgi:hypothetical protein